MRGIENNSLLKGIQSGVTSFEMKNFSSLENGDFLALLLGLLSCLTETENCSSEINKNTNIVEKMEDLEIKNINFKDLTIKSENLDGDEDKSIKELLWNFFIVGKIIIEDPINLSKENIKNVFENFIENKNFEKLRVILDKFTGKNKISDEAKSFLYSMTESLKEIIEGFKGEKKIENNYGKEPFQLNMIINKGENYIENINTVSKIVKDFNRADKTNPFAEEKFYSWEKTPFPPQEEKLIRVENEQENFQKSNLYSINLDEKLEGKILSMREVFEELPEEIKKELRQFFEKGLNELKEKGIYEGKKELLGESYGDREEIRILSLFHENHKKVYFRVREMEMNLPNAKGVLLVQEPPFKIPQGEKPELNPREIFHPLRVLPLKELPNFIKSFTLEISPRGEKEAFVQLEPPELGKIELKVKLEEGEAEIHLKVEKPETFLQLHQDLTKLREQIEEFGLKIRDFQLSLGLGTSGEKTLSEGDKRRSSESYKGKGLEDELSGEKLSERVFYHRGILYHIV